MQKYKLIGGGSAAVLFMSLFFGFFGNMKIMHIGIRDQTALKNRNEIKGFYLKVPFALDFKVYFFNITNPMEVQDGKMPILKEVGPFFYDLWKEKREVVENEAEDSLTYSPFDYYYYNYEKSAPNSDEDSVTILNPILMGMVNTVAKDSPALLNILNKAIMSIFQNPDSVYLTVKVKDLLFDGMAINCSVKDFSAKAVCTQLKAQMPDMKEAEKNIFLFSLLGSKNATLGKRVKVMRGIKRSRDLGRLLEYDGKKGITIWSTDQCNRFKGTDGWIFPPLMDKEEGIWSFSTDLCRNVQAVFSETVDFRGIQVNKFYATLGDQQSNPADKCYCPTPKTCLRKGLFDLTKCMGVPIYASLPHFFDADPIYLKQVQGLKPDKDSHVVRVHFEQMSGTPVEAKKRMQFNLPIQSITKINVTRTLPEAMHPVFWIEEGMELDDKLFKKVKVIFILKNLMNGCTYAAILASVGGLAASAYLFNKNRKQVDITPVHKFEPQDADGDKTIEVVKKPEHNTLARRLNNINNNRDASQGYDNPAMVKE